MQVSHAALFEHHQRNEWSANLHRVDSMTKSEEDKIHESFCGTPFVPFGHNPSLRDAVLRNG
jgi:hypothetical protein